MIILTNCLSDVVDEGCLKVANSLIDRIKKEAPETTVITYGEAAKRGDLHLKVNKLLLNGKLLWFMWKKKEPVLYVPAVAKGHTMAARVAVLSLAARRGLQVMQVMQHPTGKLAGLLLKWSRAEVITLSAASCRYYKNLIGQRAKYLKTGVDTERFHPVDEDQKKRLREKYSLPADKPIVLHVGHLRTGRNVEQLLALNDSLHGVLVASTYASDVQENDLKEKLQTASNVTVLGGYLPNIEEIYQLADVYLFPVIKEHNCIDTPLSALEAAACDVPVVATPYGELEELICEDGFYEISSFEPDSLNKLLHKAVQEKEKPRGSVLPYDWNLAVKKILSNNV